MTERILERKSTIVASIAIVTIVAIGVLWTFAFSSPKRPLRGLLRPSHRQDLLNVRYVRLSTNKPPLVLGQVEVFVGKTNVAPIDGMPCQSSIRDNDVARYGPQVAINGNLSATELGVGDASRTECGDQNPWWEIDLGAEMPVSQLNLWLEDRGKFPHPSSAWFVNSDMKLLVELLCDRRAVKWTKRVRYWEDVVVIPVQQLDGLSLLE